MANPRTSLSSIVYTILGLLSIMLAIAIVMVPTLLGPLDATMRGFFIAMLVLYGLFRIYTGMQSRKTPADRLRNYDRS